MNTPFSPNPKLADWKPSPHLVKIIKETRKVFEIYYPDFDTDNIFFLNLINVVASENRFKKGATTPELVEAVHLLQVIQIGEAHKNRMSRKKERVSNEK